MALAIWLVVFIVKNTQKNKEANIQALQYNSLTNSNRVNTKVSNKNKTLEKIKEATSSNQNPKNISIPFSKHFDTAPVNDIKADKSSRVWLATEKGVYKIENDNLTLYSMENGKYPFPQAECIEFDGKNLWVGSLYGVCKLSTSDRFIEETYNFDLPSNVVWNILWDGNNLWFATQKGLAFTNSNNETITLNSENTNSGLKNSWCTGFCRFLNWIAITHDSGLSLWNMNFQAANPVAWKNLDHTKSAISRPIQDIAFDGKNLWIATPTGLMLLTTEVQNLFNNFSTEMISFTELHGLPSDSINSMVFHKNAIWLGTSKGLAIIRNNQIQGIVATSGEPAESIRKLAVHGDILWIGTNKGVQFINTQQW